jgi:threonylcarbamoyladenosine tRNA methylthiotransferase MtaB
VKFFIRTYGCRANQYDSEQARQLLLASGGVEVDDPGSAEVALYNSCSVTAAAEAELRKDVRRAARINPAIKSVIIGCAPGLPVRDEAAAPLRSLPTVSDAIAGADLNALAAALRLPVSAGKPQQSAQTSARGLLRIQDGCDEHCTFCAATLARGANRSRSVRELVDEAITLAHTHPEIVLTGIHIGSYGADIDSSLSALVESLIVNVPRVRFRLSSLEATEADDRLMELFAERDRLAPYLHAPLQSGSDKILKRMGRHWYTASSYVSAIETIVGDYDVFGLGADVVVGFPGETEEDHLATMNVVERLPFTSLHVFRYSARPGTAATRLSNHVGSAEIDRRSQELRDLASRKSAAYRASRAGGIADVVTIGSREGLTEDYLSVDTSDAKVARRERFDAMLSLNGDTIVANPINKSA